MIIRELIEKLKEYDPEMEVLIDQPAYYHEIKKEHIFVQHVRLERRKDNFPHYAIYMPCGCKLEHEDQDEDGNPKINALVIGEIAF